jgi:hypothetical protein
MDLKREISSTGLALLLIAYNCVAIPLASPVVVFGWRLINVSIYGYNRYNPGVPALCFLLAAFGLEVLVLTRLVSAKNVRGLVIGLTVSLLFLPLTLTVFWFSLAIGNR